MSSVYLNIFPRSKYVVIVCSVTRWDSIHVLLYGLQEMRYCNISKCHYHNHFLAPKNYQMFSETHLKRYLKHIYVHRKQRMSMKFNLVTTWLKCVFNLVNFALTFSRLTGSLMVMGSDGQHQTVSIIRYDIDIMINFRYRYYYILYDISGY
jgi:hypothetical protein